nr:MAG TPA: hypothetical protein [Caudoviricetes sp.]DAO71816.1 MAG TPA: hypothetical protein [Caudoviricetes sp.]
MLLLSASGSRLSSMRKSLGRSMKARITRVVKRPNERKYIQQN